MNNKYDTEIKPINDVFENLDLGLPASQLAEARARAALIEAGEMQPVDRQWAAEAAEYLEMPVRAVEMLPAEVTQELAVRKLAAMPRLVEYAVENMAAMQPIARNLERIATAGASWEKYEELVRDGILPDQGWQATDTHVERGQRPDFKGTPFEPVANTGALLFNGSLGMFQSVSYGAKSIWELVAGKSNETIFDAFNRVVEQAKFEQPHSDNALVQFGYDLASNLPQVGASLALAMTTGGASALAAMAGLIYGQSYGELRQKQIDPANAMFGAAFNAALQTPLERLGIGKMVKLLRGEGKSVGGAMLNAGATEFVTEALQKWPEYAGHLWAQSSLYATDWGERASIFYQMATDSENFANGVRESLYEGLLGGVTGGVIGGVAARLDNNRVARQEDAYRAYLEQLQKESAEVARRKLLDDAFEQSVQAAQNGMDKRTAREMLNQIIPPELATMWVSPQDMATVLAHSEDAGKLLAGLGLEAETVQAAISGQMPIEVETARALIMEDLPVIPEQAASHGVSSEAGTADFYSQREDLPDENQAGKEISDNQAVPAEQPELDQFSAEQSQSVASQDNQAQLTANLGQNNNKKAGLQQNQTEQATQAGKPARPGTNQQAAAINQAPVISGSLSSKANRKFSDYLRMEPKGPSRIEVGNWDAENRVITAMRVFNHQEEADDQAGLATDVQMRHDELLSVSRSISRIKKEMAATGRLREEVDAWADLLLANALTYAENFGFDAERLLSGIAVVGPDALNLPAVAGSNILNMGGENRIDTDSEAFINEYEKAGQEVEELLNKNKEVLSDTVGEQKALTAPDIKSDTRIINTSNIIKNKEALPGIGPGQKAQGTEQKALTIPVSNALYSFNNTQKVNSQPYIDTNSKVYLDESNKLRKETKLLLRNKKSGKKRISINKTGTLAEFLNAENITIELTKNSVFHVLIERKRDLAKIITAFQLTDPEFENISFEESKVRPRIQAYIKTNDNKALYGIFEIRRSKEYGTRCCLITALEDSERKINNLFRNHLARYNAAQAGHPITNKQWDAMSQQEKKDFTNKWAGVEENIEKEMALRKAIPGIKPRNRGLTPPMPLSNAASNIDNTVDDEKQVEIDTNSKEFIREYNKARQEVEEVLNRKKRRYPVSVPGLSAKVKAGTASIDPLNNASIRENNNNNNNNSQAKNEQNETKASLAIGPSKKIADFLGIDNFTIVATKRSDFHIEIERERDFAEFIAAYRISEPDKRHISYEESKKRPKIQTYIKTKDGKALYAVFEIHYSKEHGTRGFFVTAIKDNARRIHNSFRNHLARYNAAQAGHPITKKQWEAMSQQEQKDFTNKWAGVEKNIEKEKTASPIHLNPDNRTFWAHGENAVHDPQNNADRITSETVSKDNITLDDKSQGSIDKEKSKDNPISKSTTQEENSRKAYQSDFQNTPFADLFTSKLPHEENATPHARIFMNTWNAIIQFLPTANIVSAPHELFHLMVRNLDLAAHDDGSLALESLQKKLEAEKNEAISTALQDSQEATPQATIHSFYNELQELQKAGRQRKSDLQQKAVRLEEATKARQPETTGDTVPEWQVTDTAYLQKALNDTQNSLQIAERELNSINRALRHSKKAISQVTALAQAKADLQTLCQNANIPANVTQQMLESSKGRYEVSPDDLTAAEKTANEAYNRMQEHNVNDFITYLRTGKAPSRKTAHAFSRYFELLGRFFRKAGQDYLDLLPEELVPVFDRLLACDREIRQYGLLRAIQEAESAFLSSDFLADKEREEMQRDLADVRAEFVTAYMSQSPQARQRLSKIKQRQAEKILRSDPFWQTVLQGGIERGEAQAILGADALAALEKAAPQLFTENGISPDEAALTSGLWQDAATMLNDLQQRLVTEGQSYESRIEDYVQAELRNYDQSQGQAAQEAASEFYAQFLDRLDEAWQKTMAAQRWPDLSPEEQIKKAASLVTPRMLIKTHAQNTLGKPKISSLNPDRFTAALENALTLRAEAMAEGDYLAVEKAIFNARTAIEMINEANRQRQKLADAQKQISKLARKKGGFLPVSNTEALRRTISYLTGQKMLAPQDHRYDAEVITIEKLLDLIVDQEDLLDMKPAFAEWLLQGIDSQKTIDLKNLTEDQIDDAMMLVNYLAGTGRNALHNKQKEKQAIIDFAVREATAAMKDLPDFINSNPETLRGKAQGLLNKTFPWFDNIHAQLLKADGLHNVTGKGKTGQMELLWYDLMQQTEARRAGMDRATQAIAPHVATLGEFIRKMQKKQGMYPKDSKGQPIPLPQGAAKAYNEQYWTWDRLIALALNCGNPSNMSRIRAGYLDATYEQLAELLGDNLARNVFLAAPDYLGHNGGIGQSQSRPGILDVSSWQAIQGIWDGLATFWPEICNTYNELYNTTPQPVDRQSFAVRDKEGKTTWLEGGYYPVRYDPAISDRVAAFSEQDDILARNESLTNSPQAKKGFTNARVKGNPTLPVLLNTSIIMEHLNDVMNFVYLAPTVFKIDAITRNPAFRAMYTAKYGIDDYNAIRPNLRSMLREEAAPRSDVIAKIAGKLRKHMVIWGLGANFKVAALQMTAVFPAMGDLGAKPMLQSLWHMTRFGMPALRQIWEVSPYLKSRLANIDQDLQRGMKQLSVHRQKAIRIADRDYTLDDVADAMLMPITAVDQMATGAVFLAAYNERMTQLTGNKDAANYGRAKLFDLSHPYHEQARAFADNMVKRSNPDYDSISRAGFLRAQGPARLVNMFASAITLFASRSHMFTQAKNAGRISNSQYLRFQLYEYGAPAAAMFLLMALVRGMLWGDKEEPKDWAKLGLTSFLDFYSMRLPLFGSFAESSIMSLFGLEEPGGRGGLRTSLDTPISLVNGLASAATLDLDEKSGKKLAMNAFDLLSFISKIPASRVYRRFEQGMEQWQAGRGTALSTLMPRPGKTRKEKADIRPIIF